jgi:hypothetical protein
VNRWKREAVEKLKRLVIKSDREATLKGAAS